MTKGGLKQYPGAALEYELRNQRQLRWKIEIFQKRIEDSLGEQTAAKKELYDSRSRVLSIQEEFLKG